jgi:hypothetical protein
MSTVTGKLPGSFLRQFLQRIGAASEQGDFRAAIRQSNRRRQPDPRRSARDNENAIFDLHRSILLFQFDQDTEITGTFSPGR